MASLSSVTKKAAAQPLFKVQEHIIASSYIREYYRALANPEDHALRLAVKQYTPLDNPAPHDGDVTIIGAHANGFPKELYEPLWDELYHRLKARGLNIRHIFIADTAWQGQSYVLNESKLGNDPSWIDAARDLLQMINHFSADIKQPIIGVGHSFGGNQLVHLAHIHPVLFSSVILIDPVVQRRPTAGGPVAAAASTIRRDRWPSRSAAEVAFKKSKFYQSWDARVLDLWLKYGLRDLPTHIYSDKADGKPDDVEVTLTTPKHQEVFTFLRPGHPTQGGPLPYPQPNLPLRLTHPDLDADAAPETPVYRPEVSLAFKRLTTLRPSVLFIFGGKSDLSTEPLRADKLANTGIGAGGSGGVKEGRVKGVVMEGAGHLVPLEDVTGVADHATRWMVTELARWADDIALYRQDWDRIPNEEKSVMSKSYVKTLQDLVPGMFKKKVATKL